MPKPYKKPQIQVVKLVPQEAVLQGCKMPPPEAVSGPGGQGFCGWQWTKPILCKDPVT